MILLSQAFFVCSSLLNFNLHIFKAVCILHSIWLTVTLLHIVACKPNTKVNSGSWNESAEKPPHLGNWLLVGGSTIINGRFVLITLSQTKEGSSKTFKEDICQMFYVLGKLIDEHAVLAQYTLRSTCWVYVSCSVVVQKRPNWFTR